MTTPIDISVARWYRQTSSPFYDGGSPLVSRSPGGAIYYTGIPYITVGNNLTAAWPGDDPITTTRPALPSPWTSEQAGFYFVDNETGTDTARTYGDPTAPRATIPTTIPAGSIIVLDGIYDVYHGSPSNITFNGTQADPVWITAYNSGTPPITRQKWEIDGTWTYIDGIHRASASPTTDTDNFNWAMIDSSYVTIKNCDLAGTQTVSNEGSGGLNVSTSSYILVYNNIIRDAGYLDTAIDADKHGCNINTSDDCWVLDNTFYNISGDSIQIGGQDNAGATDSNRIYVGGNVGYGNRQNHIWVKEASDIIISGNTAYDMTGGISGGGGGGYGGQYDHENVWFINNVVHDSIFGITLQSGTGKEYVIGNVIYNTTGYDDGNPHLFSAMLIRSGGDKSIHFNTLYNNAGGLNWPSINAGDKFTHNIIGFPTVGTRQLYSPDTIGSSTGEIDYNFWEGATQAISYNNSTINNLATFITNTTHSDNGVTGTSAVMTDPANEIFTLSNGSPCIDAGGSTAITAFTDFQTRYGQSIAEDFVATSKPYNTNFDIGAYEADGNPIIRNDSFDSAGSDLVGYTTNNSASLPGVTQVSGHYAADLQSNAGNITLHYNGSQGRLDAKLTTFPFEAIARNIGIETSVGTQTAPGTTNDPIIFCGMQAHVEDLTSINSAHMVAGHRGSNATYTVEGKNTLNGSSTVTDEGNNAAPDCRVDMRFIGNANNTITAYWQLPNTNIGVTPDSWSLYNGTGSLANNAPTFGDQVYVGLITYAQDGDGVPFSGTCDSFNIEET